MYSTLKAEMARKSVTIKNLADHLEKRVATISNKINGKSDFTVPEAVEIKRFLDVSMPIDELFKKE